MRLISREYKPGDELSINKLYKLITNIDRSLPEYEWEWINTWNGQGSIWLLFDEDRDKNDQLVAQYSLIPTPFSIWGKSYLAGKTENCMSHPDYRGKGIYSSHEKKYFKEAQKRFQLFFTTAGNVAKGATGAIRRKLGYLAFDSWVHYIYCTDSGVLQKMIYSKLENKLGSILGLTKLSSTIISKISFMYFYMFSPKKATQSIKLLNEKHSPLKEIETLWDNNKIFYGISVDRTSRYIDWRINKNPYFDHQYLLCNKDGELVGYIIFYKHNNMLSIIDILAANRNRSIFKDLIDNLIIYAKTEKVQAIECSTLKGNKLLGKVFRSSGFINYNIFPFRKISIRSHRQKPFHVFVSTHILASKEALVPKNWYITDLVKEGRPR